MRIGIPKEIVPGELRVSLVPDAVKKLVDQGIEVAVESGAGAASLFTDDMYIAAGATKVDTAQDLYRSAELYLKVQAPVTDNANGQNEVNMMAEGSTIIGLLQPMTNLELIKQLLEKNITSLSMDTIPRIARAQSMDALSSQSSIAGYKSVLIAADRLGIYLPMMMTAAGTYPPAKGLVLGAGVAGLQAIATGRRLGAVMQAFDVRPSVKQEVESLGGIFVGMTPDGVDVQDSGGYAKELKEDAQEIGRRLIQKHSSESDFVISTAMIPGRPAPTLITEEMVKSMKPGSIIIDIAAETGGNCELTVPGEEVVIENITIYGKLNLPSTMPNHASQMYSKNISALLMHVLNDNILSLDFNDAISNGCCITYQGTVVNEATKSLIG